MKNNSDFFFFFFFFVMLHHLEKSVSYAARFSKKTAHADPQLWCFDKVYTYTLFLIIIMCAFSGRNYDLHNFYPQCQRPLVIQFLANAIIRLLHSL